MDVLPNSREFDLPVHGWTRVEAGIFHHLHTAWVPEISRTLNGGLLPEGYYALAEQHVGRAIANVLTLHASVPPIERLPLPPDTGGTAVAEAPPRTRRKQTIADSLLARRRTLAIRHVSGHRLVALIEIVSPGNKDRAGHIGEFVGKAASALESGIHLLLIDLLPPGPNDPFGMHGAILRHLERGDSTYDVPATEPLTLASYAANSPIEVYLEQVAVGGLLPDMPLFLRPDRYVNVPLESTYAGAYAGMPAFWRAVLESQKREKIEE